MNKLAYLEGYLQKVAGPESWDVTGPNGAIETEDSEANVSKPNGAIETEDSEANVPEPKLENKYVEPTIDKSKLPPKTPYKPGKPSDANDIFDGTGIKPGSKGYVNPTGPKKSKDMNKLSYLQGYLTKKARSAEDCVLNEPGAGQRINAASGLPAMGRGQEEGKTGRRRELLEVLKRLKSKS